MRVTRSTGRTSALELLERIRRARRDDCDAILVAVAGAGAAGKSTLARAIQQLAPNEVTVIEFDDFYRPSFSPPPEGELGAGFDWRRLREQVLEPLRAGRAARYQRYNWDADEMSAWVDVPAHGIAIVEGIYSSRAELSHFYDFVIWVDAPAELRLQRGIARDGEAARERWLKEWIHDEEAFIAQDDPVSRADVRVFGFPSN
jgi:uridine kinase